MAASTLKEIVDGKLCAGCGLCASMLGPERAHMAFDPAGFLRPVVTGEPPSREEDRTIAEVCPGNRLAKPVDRRPSYGVWGPVLELYTGFARDEDLRFRASSGGALSAIVQHLLDTGEADYALHIGADGEAPWLNRLGESRSRPEVAARAGSRYAPSAPLADIVQRLDGTARFVVVGKPCDIAGLRQYARQDPRVERSVVAMVSFMCGGVPGRRGIETLLQRLGMAKEEIESFRYRGHGWPGEATAVAKDGRTSAMSYADSWGGVLSSHVQPRCKICPDGMGQFADVVCADAWYGDERGYPVFEERDGRSLVMARTRKGAQLLRNARSGGSLALEPLEMEALDTMQPFQKKRTQFTFARLAALKLLGQPIPTYKGFGLAKAATQVNPMLNLKNFLGMARRVVQRRR